MGVCRNKKWGDEYDMSGKLELYLIILTLTGIASYLTCGGSSSLAFVALLEEIRDAALII